MSLLGETSLTRRRFDEPSYVDGRLVTGAVPTDCSFLGSVQPMPERDRQVLPEGVRARDGRKVYCPRGTLRVDDQHENLQADQVLIGTAYYTVVHVDSAHELLPHDRAYVVRAQEQP